MYYNSNFSIIDKNNLKFVKLNDNKIKRITTRVRMLKKISNLNLDIKLLDEEYVNNCTYFNSGKKEFNWFLNNEALNDMKSGDGVTYVVTDILNGKETVIAYFQLSAFALHFKDNLDFEDDKIPKDKKKTRYIPINSFIIDMLAVDKNYQNSVWNGWIVSDVILNYILLFIENMSRTTIGGKIILLCSVKDAIRFYKRNGFKPLNEYMILFDKYIDGEEPMYYSIYDIPLLEY